jgi:hypothetical protein
MVKGVRGKPFSLATTDLVEAERKAAILRGESEPGQKTRLILTSLINDVEAAAKKARELLG